MTTKICSFKLRRGVRRDSMYSFSKSISQNRKENEQGKLPYWDSETTFQVVEIL